MAAAESKSDIELTKDTPYPALTGELCGVCCEDLRENWPCYNSTTLYQHDFSIAAAIHKADTHVY